MTTLSTLLQAIAAQPTGPDRTRDLLTLNAEVIDRQRDDILARAFALGEEFTRRRSELLAEGFNGLNVLARKRGRSVQIKWVIYHYKKGRRTGVENLPKSRNSPSYDLPVLKRRAPEELHEAISDIEGQLRPLREALARLTEMDTALKVVASRLGFDDLISAAPAASTDDDEDDVPHVPL